MLIPFAVRRQADLYGESDCPSVAANTGLPARANTPLINILLCTRDGGRFIGAQLDSLAKQTYQNWSLVVSDDGSTDETLRHIKSFHAAYPERQTQVRSGPRRDGATAGARVDPRQPATINFLTLISDRTLTGDLFAFCDQDDVWSPDKLERAAEWMMTIDSTRPALYCSRTRLMSHDGRLLGLSPLFAREPGFRNAMVQSLAGGNTMILNRAARDLLADAGVVDVVAHDWWAYMLVTGAGGIVHYDVQPAIDYRQHDGNLVGANQSFVAVARRVRMVLDGGFGCWMDLNLKALEGCDHLLTAENRELLRAFQTCRRGSLLQRVRVIRKIGLYRQTTRGQLALLLAALVNKL